MTVRKSKRKSSAAKRVKPSSARPRNVATKRSRKSTGEVGVKRPRKSARKSVPSSPKRRRTNRNKKRISFRELKERLSTKAAKAIMMLSFVSVAFPSTYQWGQAHAEDLYDRYQPVVAAYAQQGAIQSIEATPIAATSVGAWLLRWIEHHQPAAMMGEENDKASGGNISTKVDRVDNPFY